MGDIFRIRIFDEHEKEIETKDSSEPFESYKPGDFLSVDGKKYEIRLVSHDVDQSDQGECKITKIYLNPVAPSIQPIKLKRV